MQTHHPFIPLQPFQMIKQSSLIDKVLVTDIALGIKAPADDLALSISLNIHFRAFMTEWVLVDGEDSFMATTNVLFGTRREGCSAELAGARHGEEEAGCCESGGCCRKICKKGAVRGEMLAKLPCQT